jgi:group I intron endonuclease
MSRVCGVYMICNRQNMGFYIGSSVDIATRWRSHKATLNKGTSYSVHLQRAWSKYGADSFDFVIVEECEPSVLTEREQFWLDDTRACELGYNCNPVARQGRLGRPHTEESKEKMREAVRRGKRMGSRTKGTPCSEETKRLIANANRKRWAEKKAMPGVVHPNAMRGRTHSVEVRAKMSAARVGKPKSLETREKMRAAAMLRPPRTSPHPMLGKKHSPETIEKMRAAKRGKIATAETRSKMSASQRIRRAS